MYERKKKKLLRKIKNQRGKRENGRGKGTKRGRRGKNEKGKRNNEGLKGEE